MHRHLVSFGHTYCANIEHLGTKTGQLKHFIVANIFNFLRFVVNARIGGVHPFNISEDFTCICLHGGSQGNGRGIRAASAQSGNVAFIGYPLKPGHRHNLALIQMFIDNIRVN